MKKTLLTIYLALLLAASASAQLYQDVPKDHWARNAVDETTRLGLITGFPDGTFRGDDLLSRYQAAMILYRLVQYVESRPTNAIDPAEISAMKALIERLEEQTHRTISKLEELDATSLKMKDLRAAQADLERLHSLVEAAAGLSPGDLERLAEALPQMREVLANYVALRRDVEDLRDRLTVEESLRTDLEARVDEAARTSQYLQKALANVEASNEATRAEVNSLLHKLYGDLAGYVTTAKFKGAIDDLDSRLRETKDRLDHLEDSLNETRSHVDPKAPMLEGLKLKIGAISSSGPAAAADLDRVGGFDGDQDPTSADYSSPTSNAYFGLSSSFLSGEATTNFGFRVDTAAGSPDGYDPVRLAAFVHYQEHSSKFNIDIRPQFLYQLTPYLLDRGSSGFPYGARFSISGSALGVEAGYFTTDGSGRHASFAALSIGNESSVRAGFALTPSGNLFIFGGASLKYGGIGVNGLCHYPTALSDAAICFAQVSLDTKYIDVSADYRYLGANATTASYSSDEDDDEPYRLNQQGYGVHAGVTLGRFSLAAGWESYALAGEPHRALTASAALPLTDALAVAVQYSAATIGFQPRPVVPGQRPGQEYRNLLGGDVYFRGRPDYGLLAGLRLRLGFEIDRALPDSYPLVTMGYDAAGGAGQLALAARWRGGSGWDYKLALAAATTPLEFFAGPSLEARAAYASGADFGTETLLGFGLGLSRLPIDGLQAAFRAGYYSVASGGGDDVAAFDHVLDPDSPGVYGGGAPASGHLFYLGTRLSFAGFHFSAGRYAGPPQEVYVLKFDYDRKL